MQFSCFQCGECCRRLYWWDRIVISLSTRTVMLTKTCRFLEDSKCSIYSTRPKVCAEWPCGEPTPGAPEQEPAIEALLEEGRQLGDAAREDIGKLLNVSPDVMGQRLESAYNTPRCYCGNPLDENRETLDDNDAHEKCCSWECVCVALITPDGSISQRLRLMGRDFLHLVSMSDGEG